MVDKEQAFEDQLAAEQKVGTAARLNDSPPIGMGADGELITVAKDAPPFDPELSVEDVEGDDDDLSDLDDIIDLAKSTAETK